MDAAALWQRYQDWLYYHEQLGIYVDISRMSFDDAFVERLEPKFVKAFKEMDALEAGAIANPDENRMVGHYWLRDSNLAPTPELKKEIVTTLEKIEAFAADVHAGRIKPATAPRFTDVISIGIGGSSLGPQFVSQALAVLHPALVMHFIDNTDPAGIDYILDTVQDRLDTTLVVTISKSGGTPETRNGMLEVKNRFKNLGLDFPQHAVAVTGYGSKLAQIAESEGWLAMLPMHDWVGGRTSELSAVGLVPASLQGIAIREMLAGAKAMDEATRVHDLKTNPAALLALSWYFSGEGEGKKDMVILPYKDSLMLFSRYLQQLVMESLGKEKDLDNKIVHQGIAVYGNKGSTDQHAYVQELREGIPNFFLTFIEVLKDRDGTRFEVEAGVTSGDYLSGFLLGTREALYEKRRDSITVTLPEVTSKQVGALIALYERAVGLYASLINVNAYHQPGVEAGKKAATDTIALQNTVVQILRNTLTPLPITSLADKAGAPDKIETIYKIVRHLAANKRGVELYGDPADPGGLQVTLKG
ncbi:glucose-6-phosphate isomerase [Acaryochloris marina NIES-2412]|uniref:glucose-6-phosphate isomerase n=1 Tax=Acaryochloris marina TaxID=155978 RepID=UPI00405942BE